jgi:hypothetical protein
MARRKKRIETTKHKGPSLAERSKIWFVACASALGAVATLLEIIAKVKALF